jgi:hypothetical protein
MFPTFASLTTEHPRLIALLGASLFVFGVFLWTHVPLGETEIDSVVMQPESVETIGEKERVLQELSNPEASVPDEEKEQLLESLKR